MSGFNMSGYPTSSCIHCSGIWVGGGELRTLLSLEKDSPSISDMNNYFKQNPNVSKNRTCPTCKDTPFYVIKVKGVEIDYCNECNGVFFDEGELKKVMPNITSKDYKGEGAYVASECLFWIIFSLFS